MQTNGAFLDILNIIKDFLKQLERKINAKNWTFRLLLVVILNSNM